MAYQVLLNAPPSPMAYQVPLNATPAQDKFSVLICSDCNPICAVPRLGPAQSLLSPYLGVEACFLEP